MEAPNESSKRNLLLDVSQTVVGMLRGGNIIESQENACDSLNQDK
jgi:hypothetical protein